MAASENATAPPSRREQIVAIACDLFAEKGFQSVSVREIAERAGILSGSLYTHVSSKVELLDLGLRPYTELALADVRTIVNDTELHSRERINRLLRQTFVRMTEWRAAAAVMYGEWEYLSTIDDFAYLRDFSKEVQQLWLQAISGAVDDGTLESDVEPTVVWRLLLAIMEGVAQRYRPATRLTIDELTEYPYRMLFGGLNTPYRPHDGATADAETAQA